MAIGCLVPDEAVWLQQSQLNVAEHSPKPNILVEDEDGVRSSDVAHPATIHQGVLNGTLETTPSDSLEEVGAKEGMAPAGSHASVQKCVEAPSPTSTVTEQENKEEVSRPGADDSRAQVVPGLVRLSHSHLRRSANPRILRSGIPNPP
jgi:hypothetical protein